MTSINMCDVATLRWVGREIEVSMAEAQEALERYVEGDHNPALVTTCIDRLHQVKGTLLLIELHGAAMFAEELEAVAMRLLESRGDRTQQAAEALMSGLVAFPDYLGELRNGAPDVPFSLLPLMNDLRAVRDAPLLSETSLFAPGLNHAIDAGVDLPGSPSPDLAGVVRHARRDFHIGLLGWYGKGGVAAMEKLSRAIEEIQEAAGTTRVSRLFEAVETVIDGVRQGAIEGSVAVKRLVGSLDRVLKRILDEGEAAILEHYPFDLLKNLLYYVATANEPLTPAIRELRARYHLAVPVSGESDAVAEISLLGLSGDTYDTVRNLLVGELTLVKDRLELALHAQPAEPEGLRQLVPVLHKLSDTLGMLGLGTLRQRLLQQTERFDSALADDGMPAETDLMALASDLVFAESSLEGGALRRSYETVSEAVQGEAADELADGELQRYREAVLSEIGDEFAFVKHAVAAFVADPDQKETVQNVSRHLRLATGALCLLELENAADLTERLGVVLEDLADGERMQGSPGLVNPLADAIAGLEYYVELVKLCDNKADDVLDFAEGAVAQLVAEETALPPEEAGEELPVVVVEEGAEEKAAVPATATGAAAEQAPEETEAEAEIHDIFVEEAREQLDNIRQAYRRWRSDPDDRESLATFRRGFHTLKGSGRMVGAQHIGEFAWAVENLMNRVIDGTILASDDVHRLIDDVLVALPVLVEAEAVLTEADIDTRPLEARAFSMVGEPLPERLRGIAEVARTGPGVEEAETPAEQEAAEEARTPQEPEQAAGPAPGEVAGAEATEQPEAAEIPVGEAGEFAEEPPASATEEEPGKAAEAGAEPVSEAADFEEQVTAGGEESADREPVSETTAGGDETAGVDELPEGPPEATEEAAEEPVFALDPVLADIFRTEADGHLGEIRAFLASCRESPLGAAVTDQVIRAFHTLHGSADMAGVEPIADLSAGAERVLRLLHRPGSRVDAPVGRLLERAEKAISTVSELINRRGVEAPDWRGICDELVDLAQRLETAEEGERAPAPLVAGAPPAGIAFDPELIEIFYEEARELFEQMEGAYGRWRDGDLSGVDDLKRALHTLKGAARLAGVVQIGDLSHAFETMLNRMRASGETDEVSYFELARRACDRLMEQGDQLAANRPVAAFSDLVARLESPEGGVAAGAGEKYDEPRAAEAEPAAAAQPEAPKLEPADERAEAPRKVLRQAGVSPREGERIRISTDMLDGMVDNVGEVSIYAARLAEQQHLAQFNLGELEQTVARLRGQLRRLEIETEAQILHRYEREGADARHDHPEFDPLELDRFSTIQELSRALAETVDDLVNIREYLQGGSRDAETLLLQQSRIISDLQNALLRTRLVPFTQQVSRLERLVRQTCAPLGKKARLIVEGRDTELDRSVLEQTMPLLEHLLRNAVSHGLEKPEQRRAQGKAEEGTVRLRLARDGMDVVLSVIDDGKGLNVEAIRSKAVERGMIAADQSLDNGEVLSLILLPGFSTAKEVTQISGRGVGLDVVNSEVKQLGGTLDIMSTAGKGSTFTIRLPFSLAITDVLLVQTGEQVYAVPHSTVESVVRIPNQQLTACLEGRQAGFEYAGNLYPVTYIGQLFGESAPAALEQSKWVPALLVKTGDRRMAVYVDALVGNRQIVVKSVGPQLSVVPWIIGGTILGDGRVSLIVDIGALVRAVASEIEMARPFEEPPLRQITVMVVDDSITVRKVTGRLLARHNMNVVTAKDGVEAVGLLQETRPDVMLLDIEMPRMDGFELARHVRNNPDTAQVPIIMITSRTGDKHRERALEIGVERYLGKPYQEEELVDAIFEVLAGVTE